MLVERLIEDDSAYDGLPTLFSLLHPLDDFCPVTCRREIASEYVYTAVHFNGSFPHIIELATVEPPSLHGTSAF